MKSPDVHTPGRAFGSVQGVIEQRLDTTEANKR